MTWTQERVNAHLKEAKDFRNHVIAVATNVGIMRGRTRKGAQGLPCFSSSTEVDLHPNCYADNSEVDEGIPFVEVGWTPYCDGWDRIQFDLSYLGDDNWMEREQVRLNRNAAKVEALQLKRAAAKEQQELALLAKLKAKHETTPT